MKRYIALASSVLVAGLCMPAVANTAINTGTLTTSSGPTTFDIIRPLAKRGDVPAQYSLGYMYAEGAGTIRDYEQSAFWYSRAAGKGHNGAKYQLYELYLVADNPNRSLTISLRWLEDAADNNHSLAQHQLGRRYYLGEGVPRNYSRARDWLTKSADKGYAPARVLLAEMREKQLDKLHSVNAHSINVRSRPSGSASLAGIMHRDHQVIVLETLRGWAKIESVENEMQGWVAKRFLRQAQ